MGTRLIYIALRSPAYESGRPSLIPRVLQWLEHLVSMLADVLNPARVCHRMGYHVPGTDVFAYELWDLDHRYQGYYVGHACGRCRDLV